jgi:hypothetical protein
VVSVECAFLIQVWLVHTKIREISTPQDKIQPELYSRSKMYADDPMRMVRFRTTSHDDGDFVEKMLKTGDVIPVQEAKFALESGCERRTYRTYSYQHVLQAGHFIKSTPPRAV